MSAASTANNTATAMSGRSACASTCADFLNRDRCGAALFHKCKNYLRVGATFTSFHAYGTQSLRRTKPSLIYRKTGNLEAVQQLLGHSKRGNTARFLGLQDKA